MPTEKSHPPIDQDFLKHFPEPLRRDPNDERRKLFKAHIERMRAGEYDKSLVKQIEQTTEGK